MQSSTGQYFVGLDHLRALAAFLVFTWHFYHVDDGQTADPLLFPATNWRDVYLYDEAGTPDGWIRHRGDVQTLFDARGRRLSAQDGQPVALRYRVESGPGGWTRVVEEPQEPED